MAGDTGDYSLTLNLDHGDTLATAVNTNFSPGSALSVAYTENIGDGANRTKDVDMYRFTAVAGSTLTATTALPWAGRRWTRTFGCSPRRIQLASDDDSGGNYYSSLTYTFTASGTYYIGVSGYGNTTYNPTSDGSGVAGSVGITA